MLCWVEPETPVSSTGLPRVTSTGHGACVCRRHLSPVKRKSIVCKVLTVWTWECFLFSQWWDSDCHTNTRARTRFLQVISIMIWINNKWYGDELELSCVAVVAGAAVVDAHLRREVIVEPLVGRQDPPAAVPVACGLALLLLQIWTEGMRNSVWGSI